MLLVRLSTHWFFVKLFFMVFLFMIRSIEDATLKSCPAKLDGDLSWPNTEELSCSTSQPICLNTNLEISKRCCGENLTWDEAPKCYSLQQDIINPCPDTFVGIDNICIFAIATTFPPDCPFAETLAYDEYAAYIKTVQYPVWLPISREDGKYGKGLFYWNEQSALYKTTSTLSNVNFSHDELLLDNHCLVLIKPDNVKAVPCDEIHTAICAYRTLPDRKKSFCSQTLGQACEQSTYSPKSACFCKEHDKNLEGNKIELQMPYQNLLYTSLDEVCDIGLERKDDQYFWTYSNVSIDYTNWSPNTEFGTNFAFGAMSSDGWVLKENKDNKCSLIEKFPPYLNDSLILRYDNTSFTFTVSLTNAAYWKHKEDMEEPLLFCFTDGAEDLIVKRLDLLKSIINNVFTFLPSEGPGHYWCEGFLYPDLEVRKSNVYFLRPTNPEYIATVEHHFTADYNPLSTEYLHYVQNLLNTEIHKSLPSTTLYPRIMKIVDIFEPNSTAVLNFHLTTKTYVDLYQTYSDLLSLDLENFDITSMLIYSICIGTETENAEGKKVLWPTTPFGETAVKPLSDWCVNKEGIVITRTCGGNFIDGAVWSELDRNCFSPESVSPTLILSNLLTVKNPFLYISLFIDTMKRISDFTAEDVELCARYLQVLEEYGSRITSLSDFTSLISAIMQVPSTILKQSQQTYNSTNSILHSVSKILEKTDTFTNDTTEYLSIVIFSIEEFYSDTLIWTKTDDHAYSIKYVNSTDMNIFELEQEEEFDLGLRFNKGLIENATRSSDCKKIIVIAYFKPTLFNEDVTRNYTSTVFTTIFPNLDETGSDIQDLVTTIYKHDNPLDEYICSYWAEGYWYHKYVIEENNKTFVCSFQKMANVAMVSKANMYDLLTELLELECGVALEQALQYVKEYLSSFTDADVAKLYHILRQCQNFADTDIIMNIIDKILEMPMKLVTNAIEDYSLKFYDLLEGILEYREESYISEFKHFAVAVQYLKEDNLTGFYIDCYQFKCKIVFMHDYTQIPSSSELYLMIEEDLLNELLRIKVEKIIITLFANDVFFSTTQEYTNKALSKVVGVLLPDLTKLKRLDGRISVTYVLGAGSKNESCHTWNDLWVPSNQVRQIRHGTYRCESWYPGYFVLFYDTLNVTQLLDDAIHEQNIPFHNIINNITTISAEYLTKIRAVDIKLLANYLEESKESNFTNMQLILPDAFNASINLTSILLNVDREMFQEDETKDSGDKILSCLFHVADLLEESYSSCTWNVIFEVLYLNQNGVLGLQITDTSNYCKYKNKLFDFIINSSGIWLDSLLVSQLMEHGVQKLYLIVFSCDSFFYNGEILTNNDQVFGLYVPNIDNTFSNQVTVIFNPNVFTPGNAGCVTWEDVSTKYIKKGQWGLQKQLDSNGGCQWFQQGWFSVKLLYEPFNITSSLENLDNSLPTNEKLRQLEAISSYSEDFKPKDVFLLLNILLSCKDLSKGDLNILQRISTRFCDIPNSVKRDAERLYYTNRMILKIVSLVGSIIDTNTAYTIGNSFQIISCNLNQNKELYLARNFISCQQISEHEYNTNLVYYGNTVAPLFSVIALQSNDLFDQEYETSQILGISTLVTQDTFITKFKITFKHDQYNVPSYSCACWNNHQWSYFHTLQSDSNTSCYINDLEHCEYVTLANLDINKILNDVYSRDDEQDSKCDDTSCTTTLQVTLNALSNHLSELKSSDIDIIFNIFNKIDLDTEEQIEYMADIIDLLMNLDREILAQAQTYNNSTEKLHECINRLVKSYKGSVNIKRKNFAVIIQQKITGILFDRNGPEYFIKDVISNAEQMDSCHTALLINNTYQNTVGPSEYYTTVTVYFNDALFIGEYNAVNENNGIIVGVGVSDDNLKLSMSMSFENYKNNTNCVYWKHKALDSKTETGYWEPISTCPCESKKGTYFALLESQNVTNDLEQVFHSNASIEEQLQKVINIMDVHNQILDPFDVHLIASIMGKLLNESTVTTQHMDFSSEIISKLSAVNINVLQQSQEKYGATDNILYTIDETTQLCNDTFSSAIIYNNFLLTKINVQNSNITGVFLNNCSESICNMTPLYHNQTTIEFAEEISFRTALVFSEALRTQIDENTDPVNLIVSVHFSSHLFREHQRRSLTTSKILGIILEGLYEELAGPIFLIHNKDNVEETANSSCAYWKYQIPELKGYWKDDTIPNATEEGYIICEYSHLTHFVLLLAGSSDIINDLNTSHILDMITNVNSVLSLLGLFGILLTAVLFDRWRNNIGNQILINFTLAVSIKNVMLYISEGISNENKTSMGCTITGGILHYSILSEFCWMLIIAILQFKRFVEVLGGPLKYVLLKACICGWVFPALPVFLIFIIDMNNYNKSSVGLCYPTKLGLYLGVWLPLIVIISINFVIFIFILYNVFHKKTEYRDQVNHEILFQWRLAILLFSMLGLTWLFGFAALIFNTPVFAVVFCFMATLQGFIMFLFFIVFNKSTRYLYVQGFNWWMYSKGYKDRLN